MKKNKMYLLLTFFFTACSSLVVKEKIIDNYYLVANDTEDACALSYQERGDDIYSTVIEPTVFAIGHDNRYIIAKQHPRTFPDPPNKTITNYFILPLKRGMNFRTNTGLIGPLTELEFVEKRHDLNIPDDLTFTKEIENLK